MKIKILLEPEIPEYEYYQNNIYLILKEEISKLTKSQQEAIKFREYDGLSYEEIANITGKSWKTWKMRHYKALVALRNALQKRVPNIETLLKINNLN